MRIGSGAFWRETARHNNNYTCELADLQSLQYCNNIGIRELKCGQNGSKYVRGSYMIELCERGRSLCVFHEQEQLPQETRFFQYVSSTIILIIAKLQINRMCLPPDCSLTFWCMVVMHIST